MHARSHLVLVVDSDLAVRESLKFALELEGLEVFACASGEDLLVYSQLMRADCLILNHQMPGMDGFAVLGALRARHCLVPVILVTGDATAGIHRCAASAGVRHVIEKPLLDNALIESITEILNYPAPPASPRKSPPPSGPKLRRVP